jgi:hypothetical protein
MGDLIDLARRREGKRFGTLVDAVREPPLPTLVEALVAARDMHELAGIVDQLAALIIYSTSAPDTAS